jgi:hypothetical protein
MKIEVTGGHIHMCQSENVHGFEIIVSPHVDDGVIEVWIDGARVAPPRTWTIAERLADIYAKLDEIQKELRAKAPIRRV